MKWIATLMLLCLIAMPALPEECIVPEDVLHDAVMTLCTEDDGGECWTEGHVVLGQSDRGKTVEVYASIYISNYGFMDGVFTDTGSGAMMPVTLVFSREANEYVLREIITPEDGERYDSSIRAMFPAECVRMLERGAVDRDELMRQQHAQAQDYLDSIGRTEMIQDWRERDLQLADMLVYASNFVIDLSPPYPLWVTSTERIEDGVRYVYKREWFPDEDPAEHPEGVTGTQLLTKARYDDGSVVETITIRAELLALTVTMEDAGGTRTYSFAYDGQQYRRPAVVEEGKCGVRYEIFDLHCAELEE